MPLILALLLLAGCAAPQGPWVVQGASPDEERQAQGLVEAAKRVLPDDKGWLARGGFIEIMPDVGGYCFVPSGWRAAGCSYSGAIYVRWPHGSCGDLTCSALPHELAHLGLASGGGTSGPVNLVSESQADAGALLIVQEYRRTMP